MRDATLATFTKDRKPTPAEQTLIEATRLGEVALINLRRPTERVEADVVRTDLIAWLAMGGGDGCRPSGAGVTLQGAWVAPPAGAEEFDLRGERLTVDLALWNCHIAAPLMMLGAKTQTLALSGSKLAAADSDGDALVADGAEIGGNLFLAAHEGDRFEADGAVRLLGATIGGVLDCVGAKLVAGANAVEGAALIADGLSVTGSVFLSAGADHRFEANGAVRLPGATIGGNLTCVGGRFRGDMVLQNASVTGALQAWDAGPGAPQPLFTGDVYLSYAKLGRLADAEHAWDDAELILDGLTYDGFSGNRFPKTASARVAWLGKQRPSELLDDFRQQPWRQLQKTFEEEGETTEARRVAVAWERQRRRAGRVMPLRLAPLETPSLARRLLRLVGWPIRAPINLAFHAIHRFYGFSVGYGYFNTRGLLFAIAFWALGWWIFAAAWNDGAVAPPLPFVLASKAWTACDTPFKTGAPTPYPHTAACWVASGKPGERFYQFSPALYSFDVFLPILTIEQEESWAPTLGRGAEIWDSWVTRRLRGWFGLGARPMTLGDIAWSYRITHEILGYVLSAFILAGLTRLVRDR